MVAPDAAICMRVKSGHQHTFANHAIGWYHWLKDPIPKFHVEQKREAPTIDAKQLLASYANTGPGLEALARSLGVTFSALQLLECKWSQDHRAWAFPMRGGDGEYRGIRLRSDSGKKWAVTGSKEGVFFAFGIPTGDTLFVVEGPTDTAAGMSIGLDCVGRPSCYGGVDEVRIIVRNHKYRRVVVVSDSDEVGRRGAQLMANAMFVPHCILTLVCKDLRKFVNLGGTKAELDYMLRNLIWSRTQQRKEKP